MPKPNEGESQQEFMHRCMADPESIESFPEEDQRAAFCHSQWDNREGKIVRAAMNTEVKAGDGDSRAMTFTISTPSIDRAGDTIDVKGWRLDSYRKNPVVLWAHDATMLPVGRAKSVEVRGSKLIAEAEFTPLGMSRFNDTVFAMYRDGFLNATSVGFLPLKFDYADEPERKFGINFKEQELMEFSAVPVPANPEALIEARSAGIPMGPMFEYLGGSDGIIRLAENFIQKGDLLAWAELLIEEHGKAVVTRDRIERVERAATQDRLRRLRRKRQRELDVIRLG